jgi:four helix bundle protein
MSGRDIKAWQKANELVVEVYSSTRSFPREEIYGLANQLRRASVSIPSNIAEGKDAPTRSFFSFYTMPADQSSRSRPNLPSPEGWLR